MTLTGIMAALAATGDTLNTAESTIAQLRAENEQLRAQVDILMRELSAAELSEPREPQPQQPDATAAGDPPATPAAP